MIKATLKLPGDREIPILIRERHLRKLTTKIEQMSFWEKVKVLFKNG